MHNYTGSHSGPPFLLYTVLVYLEQVGTFSGAKEHSAGPPTPHRPAGRHSTDRLTSKKAHLIEATEDQPVCSCYSSIWMNAHYWHNRGTCYLQGMGFEKQDVIIIAAAFNDKGALHVPLLDLVAEFISLVKLLDLLKVSLVSVSAQHR